MESNFILRKESFDDQQNSSKEHNEEHIDYNKYSEIILGENQNYQIKALVKTHDLVSQSGKSIIESISKLREEGQKVFKNTPTQEEIDNPVPINSEHESNFRKSQNTLIVEPGSVIINRIEYKNIILINKKKNEKKEEDKNVMLRLDTETLNRIQEKQDLDENKESCFICGENFLKEATFKGTSCPKSHSFCYKCGEEFYERNINQNEIMFNGKEPLLRQLQSCNNLLLIDENKDKIQEKEEIKATANKHFYCPIYRCLHNVDVSIVNKLVSKDTFDNYIIQYNNYSSASNQPLLSNKQKSTRSDYNLFKTKHMINLSKQNKPNNLIERFSKNKELFCFNCQQPSLFNKKNTYYYRCMNCLKTECKFCHKALTKTHYDITDINNYCRVYFRSKLSKNENKVNLLIVSLIIIASVIFFICGLLSKTYQIINDLFFYPEDELVELQNVRNIEKEDNIIFFKRRFYSSLFIKNYKKTNKVIVLIKYFIYLPTLVISCCLTLIIGISLWPYVPALLVLGIY